MHFQCWYIDQYITHTLLHQGKIAQISTLIAYHFFLILHNFSVYYIAQSLPYFNVNYILKVLHIEGLEHFNNVYFFVN